MWWINVLHRAYTQIKKYFLQQINKIPLVLWDSLPIVIHCTHSNANKQVAFLCCYMRRSEQTKFVMNKCLKANKL